MKEAIEECELTGYIGRYHIFDLEGIDDITKRIHLDNDCKNKNFLFLASPSMHQQLKNLFNNFEDALGNGCFYVDPKSIYNEGDSASFLVKSLLSFSFSRNGCDFHVFIYPHFSDDQLGFIVNEDIKFLIKK